VSTQDPEVKTGHIPEYRGQQDAVAARESGDVDIN
jgi:hypothetical protein